MKWNFIKFSKKNILIKKDLQVATIQKFTKVSIQDKIKNNTSNPNIKFVPWIKIENLQAKFPSQVLY